MKLLKLTFAIFIGLLAGLASCDDNAKQDIRGDDGNPSTGGNGGSGGGGGGNGATNGDPAIAFEQTPGDVIQKGDSVSFTLTVESSSPQTNLKKLSMEVMAKDAGGLYQALSEYKDSQSFSAVPTTGANFGFRVSNVDFGDFDSVKAQFKLVDEDNQNVTESYVFAIGEIFRDKYFIGGDSVIPIYHKYTPKQSNSVKTKFDLYYYENNTTQGYVPGAGSKATIADDSKDSSSFNRQWTTETDAEFVKANGAGIDFQRPFDIQIEQAYKNRDPKKTIINISANDLIIVKLRNQGRFALLKIVDVVDNQSDPTSSFISFKGKGKDIRN